MRRVLLALAVVPSIALLAACAPAVHTGASGPSQPSVSGIPATTPSATPVLTPTPTPTTPAAPPVINPADYLVDGTPHHPDANDEWFGEYAFWTDATKTVWCEETIYSGDNPDARCVVIPSARSQVTYPLPPNSSANCAKSDWDGYEIGLGGAVDDLIPKNAGFDGCWDPGYDSPTILAETKVLPDGASLAVSPFKCTVNAGVASCGEAVPNYGTPSFTFGLHVATFHST